MPDLVHCRDCRHWATDGGGYEYYDPEADDGEPYEDGEAMGDYVTSSHGRCRRVLHIDKAMASARDPAAAFVTDASGYSATLWGGPDFGCTLGKRKESDHG